MDWQLKLTNDVVDLVSDSFLLFSDPYHKAVYQLPTTSTDSYEYEYTGDVQSSWLSVRGVPMPTDAQYPVSVSVSAQQAIVYWIDSSARRILSSHFNTDQHRVLVTLPTGTPITYFSERCFWVLFATRCRYGKHIFMYMEKFSTVVSARWLILFCFSIHLSMFKGM